jgi:hypothetical protein
MNMHRDRLSVIAFVYDEINLGSLSLREIRLVWNTGHYFGFDSFLSFRMSYFNYFLLSCQVVIVDAGVTLGADVNFSFYIASSVPLYSEL